MMPKDCPVNPVNGPAQRRKTPKKHLESRVVRECMLFLRAHPDVIYVERRNTGMVRFQDGGAIRFGSKGAADIWCLLWCHSMKLYPDGERMCNDDIDGSCAQNCHIHVEIEAKRADGKGRQSADQKKFQVFCDDNHIPYILTTSATDLAKKLSAISY